MSALLRTSAGPCAVAIAIAIATAAVSLTSSPAQAAPAGPNLGTAAAFAVLAASTVTNTGPTTISGDLGLSPGTAVSGFGPGLVVGGSMHIADGVALTAQNDLTSAYNTAAGLPPSTNVTADLGGRRLAPGVYAGPTLSITGALTLDAGGDPNAVFVFQAGSTLVTASASSVLLLGMASPCNVFWQVGSSATLGTNSSFVGSVLAFTSVTANTGASVAGRLMARNAAVTLDSNAVTRPACSATATSPPASPVPAPTPPASTVVPAASPTSATTPNPAAPPANSATPTPTPTLAPVLVPGASPTVPPASSTAPTPAQTATATPSAAPLTGPGADLARPQAAATAPSTATPALLTSPPESARGQSPPPGGPAQGLLTGYGSPVDQPATVTGTMDRLPLTGAPVGDLMRSALAMMVVGLLALASSRRPRTAAAHKAPSRVRSRAQSRRGGSRLRARDARTPCGHGVSLGTRR